MNEIEFCVENYLSDNTSFEEARDMLNDDLIATINVLLKNKYIMAIRENCEGLVKIEFNYSNYHFDNENSHTNPYWITRSQYNSLLRKDFYDRLP